MLGLTFLISAAAVGCILAWTLCTIFRRLIVHPYRHVPGPFLAKITDLYGAYHSWRGTMHLDIQRCHQKYSDLIRYGPNRVISLHPGDVNEIYSHRKPFKKSSSYETMIPISDGWSAMTSIDKDLHYRLRRTFRSGTTTENLALYEPAILRNLHLYFDQIFQVTGIDGWSSSANMIVWNLCLGFDTMADFGLGLKTNLLCSNARDFVFPTLYVHEKKMGFYEQLPILDNPVWNCMVTLGMGVLSSNARQFYQWYQTFLQDGIANNSDRSQGIFGPVIQSGMGKAKLPGHNASQMIGEGAFSTFSSADAYGIMLSGFLHYLSSHPEVYKKLATELREKFHPGQEIRWNSELESITYLRAVIDEVMRLLPPACGVHWRECEQAGVNIGRDHFQMPVGGDIGMSMFSIFRDRRIFRDPVLFWPESWLPGTLPEPELKFAKKMFTPFLIGPCNCAGGHVAIMIANIAFAPVLVNYDFRFGSEQLTLAKSSSNRLWSNTPEEAGSDVELLFESHYSITGWEKGPFIQFKKRESV